MICAAPTAYADVSTILPDSPFDLKPNNDFSIKAELPKNGWGDYESLQGTVNADGDTVYESPDDLTLRSTDTFIRGEPYTEIDLNGHALRFDIQSEISKFGVVDQNNGVISFTGGGSLQIRHAPSDSSRATETFNIKKSSASLSIDVDNLWIEFIGKSQYAANIIKSFGEINIRSTENTVFLMSSEAEATPSTVALIELMAANHDHQINGKKIFFKYGDDYTPPNNQYGIWTSQNGGTLTIGSDSTELIQIANAKTALLIDGYESTTKLTADRIELIAPDQGGVAAITGTTFDSSVELGKSASDVFIVGFDTAVSLSGNNQITAGTVDAPLKYFESDGDLVSKDGSSLSIAAEKVILNGNVYAEYASADIDFGKSGSWIGKSIEVDGGSISAKMSSGTEWKLTGSSSLANLEATNAVIDLSNHDEAGLPQIDPENPITLSVGTFKGADNRFIFGTNLAEGVSSQITISGGTAPEGEDVQYVSVNDVDSALDLTNFEETLFASVNENAGITFEGVEALSARGLTLQTPGVRSETENGIVKWFFTPEGGETKPGYTPQAAHQSLDAGYYLWRSIDEGTRERFGDLRKGAAGGAWGRISAGRLSHDGFETDYAAYRLGFDGAPSENTRLGVLFEYVDGDVDGRWGDGDSKLASGAVYGLWMSETGSYFDAGVRVGHYDASYDNKTELIDSFDLRSMAYGAWVETGHEFALSSGFFVTPHFGLNIGRIDGEDFTTNQGIRARTDSVESAIASYGVDFGMSSSAWTASASIVGKTEMLGDMAMRASSAEGSISERWSHSDTWFEAGVAAAFRPTENLQAWLNVKRSFCSEIDADWHVNVGIRRSF